MPPVAPPPPPPPHSGALGRDWAPAAPPRSGPERWRAESDEARRDGRKGPDSAGLGRDEPPAEAQEPPSRRSVLGLGALAGASASAVIVGIASTFDDSRPTTTPALNGVPVVTTDEQRLSAAQQQQAATNIGAVRTVEPEQFPGGSDDEQLSNAFRALQQDGGLIRLRPGKTYTWRQPPGPRSTGCTTPQWCSRPGVPP